MRARLVRFSGRRLAVVLLLTGVGLAGCASMLGIDGEYVEEKSVAVSTGGRASASGGASGSGGIYTGGIAPRDGAVTPASGGEPAATGGMPVLPDANLPRCAAGTNDCENGKKCCDGICVLVEPLSGCGAPQCAPCPRPPDSAIVICDGEGACANKCIEGYQFAGDDPAVCEKIAVSTGGASGTGGAGSGGVRATGGVPACTADGCKASGPPCLNPIQGWLHCCKNDNTCGCTWAPDLPRGETPYCL